MVFWILVAVLTAAVAALLLLPLLKGAARPAGGRNDSAVYRDQLQEVDRDLASGLINAEEAQFARAEVGRRLLAASQAAETKGSSGAHAARNRIAQALIIVLLPAIGLCLYLATGNPGAPDRPLAERLENPGDDMNILIARAERHLAQNPGDAAGWDLLAPIYYRSGRLQEAARAFDSAIKAAGPTPARLAGLAESAIALSGGTVNAEAQDALKRLLTLTPGDPRASFYLALALKQEGKTEEARKAFTAIAEAAPKDAPWLPLVNQHLSELGEPAVVAGGSGEVPGNPTAEDVAAAETLSAGERQAMIRGMVDSLSARLKENPDNFDGWMRLIRSHSVLNDKRAAAAALKEGLKAFPAAGEEGQKLLALARELGVPAEGEVQ